MKLFEIFLIGLVCLIVALSGCASNNSTSSSDNSKLNASSSDEVNFVINYSGSWAADVSGPFGYRSFAGSGDQTNSLGSVTGTITVAARKTDSSTGTLIVTITKGGKIISSQSTSYPYGGATAVATI